MIKDIVFLMISPSAIGPVAPDTFDMIFSGDSELEELGEKISKNNWNLAAVIDGETDGDQFAYDFVRGEDSWFKRYNESYWKMRGY